MKRKLILLLWTVGAIAALCGAFCYSELGINFPSSGGEYVYLTKSYGPTWGFMSGWVSVLRGILGADRGRGTGVFRLRGVLLPAVKQANASLIVGPASWGWKLGGAQIVACVLVAFFTILNFFGVQRVAKIQNLLTGIKVAVIGSFILLAFTVGHGDWGHFSVPATRWTSDTDSGTVRDQPRSGCTSATAGGTQPTYVAEELRHPSRTLPLALNDRHDHCRGPVPDAERGIHLRGAAGVVEGRGGGGVAGGGEAVRTGGGGDLQRPDGAGAAGDG